MVSGAARGQGRSHAVALAREGASIVAFDICEPLAYPLTPGATDDDLQETVRLVEEHDQQCLAQKVDARDLDGLMALATRAMDALGRVDILVINHGIFSIAPNSWELDDASWSESIDILLTGVWRVTKAFIPKILEGGRGGSIVLTSSVNAVVPQPGAIAYCAAKGGVVSMGKVLAWELGEHDVRVNTILPAGTATPMAEEGGTVEMGEQNWPRWWQTNRTLLTKSPQHQPPQAISDAVLFLASDDARHITGTSFPVDSGYMTF